MEKFPFTSQGLTGLLDQLFFLTDPELQAKLLKAAPPTSRSQGEDEGKLLDLDKEKKASYAADGDFSESEELTFMITYS